MESTDARWLASRFDRIDWRLDQVVWLLHQVLKGEHRMAGELDILESKITPMTSAVDGAVTLLEQLSALVRSAAMDPQRVLAVADQIDVKTQALAAAIVANTPSAP